MQGAALILALAATHCGSDDELNIPTGDFDSSTGGTTAGKGGSGGTGGSSLGGSGGSGGSGALGGTGALGGSAGMTVSAAGRAAGGRAARGGAGGAVALAGRSASAGRGAGGGSAGASMTANCSSTPLSGGSQHCSSNATGNVGSYSWNIWSSGSGGCITPYGVDAAFKATWNNSGDFLARVGLALGSNKTHTALGTFAADFSETHSGSAGGFSYIGIYGWSVNPLKEYYIVEDWFGSRPNPGGSKVGTITVDDGTYDIYKHTQNNQPAITGGNATFDQFFSIRTTARQCGHISISEHFKQWDSLGLTLGNLEECRILVEAGGGSGSADFTAATLTVK